MGRLVVMTMFQFTYTTLFGAYAAYAYIRTASLPAIIVCHAFCNYMGLPNLAVFQQQMYRNYRWILVIAYGAGIIGFILGFSTLLPDSDLLQDLVV
eukprot:CAMPEP_0116540956 /NCGR_PEP_ID=MMETSP0397-20121206/226_1 /TAXON_ID=216820 /ORGANISM="Cyclophora tenuis, Strain ECT3854" /LENGTH=95 /DNA_ID=CAMNT_0004064867 /DNA_START=232 /DNA_END=519 /DNA_ORIENTATION=+